MSRTSLVHAILALQLTLQDPDLSIRRRALSLAFALVNEVRLRPRSLTCQTNVKSLVKELLAFLEVCDPGKPLPSRMSSKVPSLPHFMHCQLNALLHLFVYSRFSVNQVALACFDPPCSCQSHLTTQK